ncbi:MAG: ribonuclease HII [Candidatus Aenigmarchaeota archaeon]|nr:ribonuclease HII [Candidatus Aenigmarchaeota archaeon]
MKVLGIDESGKGPVIGPLVICGYLVDSDDVPNLRKLGVKDSKLLTRKQRERIAGELERIAADIAVLQVSAAEIDRMRTETNLNKLEIRRMAGIIDAFGPGKVIIDALEANETKFGRKVSDSISCSPEIVAKNFADRDFPEVSAASIIAKVTRDREIDRLKEVYGDFGSGYPSDPATIGFLKDWIKANKGLPDMVRKSWLTVKWITAEVEQTSLRAF